MEVLRRAKIYGCGYGSAPLGDHGGLAKFLWLVGDDESALRQSFEIFKSWTVGTDYDALSLQIIILDSGGYLLLLGPDPDRAQIRIAGYGSILKPVIYAATYAKRMDTTSPFVRELYEYVQQALSPVMFGAALAPRGPGQPPQPLAKCPELTLHRVRVVREDEAMSEPALRHFVERDRGVPQASEAELRRPDSPSPDTVSRRRETMLHKLFPVTMFRIRHEGDFVSLKSDLLRIGIRQWQVEQAICNLQLTSSILQMRTNDEDVSPWSVLASRFEDLETTLLIPTKWQLEEQLLVDAHALLTAVIPDYDRKLNFYECAGELAHLGFLDA